jgi:hypothetical protein
MHAVRREQSYGYIAASAIFGGSGMTESHADQRDKKYLSDHGIGLSL